MIKTDLPEIEKDLLEEISLFNIDKNIIIRHLFKETENKLVNTIVVDGKAYAYGNLVKKFSSEIERKRIVKRFAKLSLYKALMQYTGNSLPWGSLTGIRPTALAYNLVKEEGEFKEYFTDVLKVSPQKTLLTEKVLNSQKNYYFKNDLNTDLFIFIPFCPSRCNYCSFICQDIKSAEKSVDKYIDILIKEINESKKFIKNLRSIYIGGGTPFSISADNLEKLLCQIDLINTGVEFTVEAGRADVITKEKLEIIKKHKVNRICINPQTFNNNVLKNIGRNHTVEDVVKAYEMAKNDFIINMDLIAGLSGETYESFCEGIKKVINLAPDNITVHSLCLKKGADIDNNSKLIKSFDVGKMVDFAYNNLTESGYNPYYLYRQKYMADNLENTGYAKKGKECIYNIDTMEEISSTIACGANAISKRIFTNENRIERYGAPKDILTYMQKIDEIIDNKNKLFN